MTPTLIAEPAGATPPRGESLAGARWFTTLSVARGISTPTILKLFATHGVTWHVKREAGVRGTAPRLYRYPCIVGGRRSISRRCVLPMHQRITWPSRRRRAEGFRSAGSCSARRTAAHGGGIRRLGLIVILTAGTFGTITLHPGSRRHRLLLASSLAC